MAPHAHGPQVGEGIGPAGLGLEDVIDLGGSADADVGVAQLAGIAVSLEHPSATLRPVTPIGVSVRRGLLPPGGASTPRAVDATMSDADASHLGNS
jgi:hypothetical protein